MQAIWKRHSVREFLEKQIPMEKIDILLDAGMQAPSAGNARPWHFIVENRKEIIRKIILFHHYAKMLDQAPAIIIVCSEPEKEKFEGFWPQDCAACTENILIEATQIGLGAVWLGIYPDKKRIEGIKKLFNLPENIVPFAVIALGYPKNNGQEKCRYEIEKVHYRVWGEKWIQPTKKNKLDIHTYGSQKMKICIKNMEIFSHHGLYDFEKENGQLFIISIEISTNYDIRNSSDLIEQTVDYAKLYKKIYHITTENRFNLIESLAQQIALELLEEFLDILEVSVKVKKPNAPIDGDFKFVGTEITLSR